MGVRARRGWRTNSHSWAPLDPVARGEGGRRVAEEGTIIRPSAQTTTTSAGPLRYCSKSTAGASGEIVSPINCINGTKAATKNKNATKAQQKLKVPQGQAVTNCEKLHGSRNVKKLHRDPGMLKNSTIGRCGKSKSPFEARMIFFCQNLKAKIMF